MGQRDNSFSLTARSDEHYEPAHSRDELYLVSRPLNVVRVY